MKCKRANELFQLSSPSIFVFIRSLGMCPNFVPLIMYWQSDMNVSNTRWAGRYRKFSVLWVFARSFKQPTAYFFKDKIMNCIQWCSSKWSLFCIFVFSIVPNCLRSLKLLEKYSMTETSNPSVFSLFREAKPEIYKNQTKAVIRTENWNLDQPLFQYCNK